MTRQRQKSKPVIRYLFWLALVIIVSCDPFEEDALEDKDLVTFGQTEYFTLPGSTVVIDVGSVVKQSFVDATIKVSQPATKGKIVALDTLMLKYIPLANFIEGADRFVLSILRNGNAIATCDVVITMMSKVDDFPCAIFAVEDFVVARMSSATPIKVLENDRVCGAEMQTVSHSIHLKPKHGHAVITGDSIVYEPQAGYIGNDMLVYQIAASQNSEKSPWVAFGLVNISVRDFDANCSAQLEESYILDLSDIQLELTARSSCGFGYEVPIQGLDVCQNAYLTMGPFVENAGSFCLTADGKLMYMPQKSTHNPTAKVRVCLNNKCKVVAVKVILGPDDHPEWEPGWSQSIIPGTDGDVSKMFFVNDLVGYVASSSTMFKTFDGAQTWRELTFGVPSRNGVKGHLWELDFVTEEIGYAAYSIYDNQSISSSAGVMRTTDGGETWTLLASFEERYLYGADFVNDQLGYVTTDREILRTIDGGASWQEVLKLAPVDGVPKVRFMKNGTCGYVQSFSRLYKTVDSGETWQVSFENSFPLLNDEGDTTGITHRPIPDFDLASTSGILIANVASNSTSDLYRSQTGAVWMKAGNNFMGQVVLSPLGTLGLHYVYADGIRISIDWAESWRQPNIDASFNHSFVAASVPSERVAYVLASPGTVLRFVKN